jgi:hypothetical protein
MRFPGPGENFPALEKKILRAEKKNFQAEK